MKIVAWVIGVPVGLFVLFLAVGLSLPAPSPEQQAKERARAVISLCWEDQKKKSLDPSTARIVAGMCEKFESDFRREYKLNP